MTRSVVQREVSRPIFFQAGLTMIELLIVLAILGLMLIMSTVSVVKYINQSRDGIRKSHIEKYRVAFEEYLNDRGEYPPDEALTNCGGSDLQPYMSKILCDPITKEPYYYRRGTDNKATYQLFTNLVLTSDPVIALRGCQSGCGPDVNSDGTKDFNYGIDQSQVYSERTTEDTSTFIQPTCGGSTRAAYCFPNICSECCPGVNFRCNAQGNGCYIDYTCNDI